MIFCGGLEATEPVVILNPHEVVEAMKSFKSQTDNGKPVLIQGGTIAAWTKQITPFLIMLALELSVCFFYYNKDE